MEDRLRSVRQRLLDECQPQVQLVRQQLQGGHGEMQCRQRKLVTTSYSIPSPVKACRWMLSVQYATCRNYFL